MEKHLVVIVIISILIETSVCQLVFPSDSPFQQQNYGGFQQPQYFYGQQNSNFPYNNNIFLQNQWNQPIASQRNHLSPVPATATSFQTPRPSIPLVQPTPKPVPPSTPHVAAARPNLSPLVVTPPPGNSNQQGSRPFTTQTNNLSERISRKKCYEYRSLSQKKLQFGGLSFGSTSQDVSTSQCDLTTGLVIGGLRASDKEFPHMAGIFYRSLSDEMVYGCGGSLISERFVLTSAHCDNQEQRPATDVRLGILDLTSPNGEDFSILEFIVHDKYDVTTKQNDIAVVKLDHDACESLKFPRYIRPACVWQTESIFLKNAIASGWGYTEYAGTSSKDLMKVKLDLLDVNRCVRLYSDDGLVINEKHICAGVLSGGHDTCQGDSGGPLQVVLPGSKCLSHVIGITSFGGICGAQNQPSVYTRVSSYLDWIEAKVWG